MKTPQKAICSHDYPIAPYGMTGGICINCREMLDPKNYQDRSWARIMLEEQEKNAAFEQQQAAKQKRQICSKSGKSSHRRRSNRNSKIGTLSKELLDMSVQNHSRKLSDAAHVSLTKFLDDCSKRLGRKFHVDNADSEDLAMEAYCRVLAAQQGELMAKPKEREKYAYTVLYNLYCDYAKKRHKQVRDELALAKALQDWDQRHEQEEASREQEEEVKQRWWGYFKKLGTRQGDKGERARSFLSYSVKTFEDQDRKNYPVREAAKASGLSEKEVRNDLTWICRELEKMVTPEDRASLRKS